MNAELKWFVIENTWLSGMDHGWGNGYVAVPKDHPIHGMNYDAVHEKYPTLSVHYGLTFSGLPTDLRDLPEGLDIQDYWVVGFDTAHYQDTSYGWTKNAVEMETKRLLAQIKELKT